MKLSKLLHHIKTKHTALKDKPLELFKRKNMWAQKPEVIIEGHLFIKSMFTGGIILNGLIALLKLRRSLLLVKS